MKYELSKGNKRNILGILSISMPLFILLLIANWFWKITAFQKLGGMPLLIAPFVGLIGIVLSFISFKQSDNRLWKLSLACNVILLVLPLLYWTLGTLAFGV